LQKREISYLGYVISSNGVTTCPKKILAVAEWPPPKNVKELKSFLGLSGYYRKFVKHYAIISKPLIELLKKHHVFHWTSDQEVAFNTLTTTLITAPVLAFPNFDIPFAVETDASDLGVGAVLLQDKHPLTFISKPLGPKLRGLSPYEKEYVALLLAVEQWRPYLQLGEFHIYTGQKSLSYLNE
jgi:hypothetical protein